jgi:acyl-CoA synthetase (AMP-forming)/AMP-acid ligase II
VTVRDRHAEPVASVADAVFGHASSKPESLAVRWLEEGEGDGVCYSYRDLDLRCRQVGAALREQVQVGARVLIMSPPGFDYVASFLGCLYAGVIAVPAYPPSPFLLQRDLERLQGVVQSASATVALTTSEWRPLAESADFSVDGTPVTWMCADEMAEGAALERPEPVTRGELAFLQYTSGSTSEPKGVMVTHGNIEAQIDAINEIYQLPTEYPVVSWLPPYHDMGLIGTILATMRGGQPATLMPPLAFLRRPMRWLKCISRFRAVATAAPNFGFDLAVRRHTPDDLVDLDLSCLSIAINGAEPIRQAVLDRFVETFAPYGFEARAIWPSYGLAEATLAVSAGRWRESSPSTTVDPAALADDRVLLTDNGTSLVSCGRPPAQFDVAVVDRTSGEPLPEAAVGELVLHGPSVTEGYWGNTEETGRVFRRDDDGEMTFRTGDLGFLLDGHIYVTGRLKDLIIVRGRNHYPHDIELTVEAAHPQLRPGCAAAFTIAGDDTEHLAVVQELRSTEVDGAEEIAGAIREAVTAAHQIAVDVVALIPPRTIPKTSSGKIRRAATKERLGDGSLEPIYLWRSRALAESA